jgi:hypothetical protein
METWKHRHETWKHSEIEKWRHGYMETSNRRIKTEDQAIFLSLFTICLLYKQKFVVCPIFYKETNRNYTFANGLNGLSRLAHL